MTLSEFIGKWVCSDSFSMMDKQGTISFQGLTCIARFPSPYKDGLKELVYAFSLPEISEEGLFTELSKLDNLLTKTYRLDK